MLEADGILKTWELLQLPSSWLAVFQLESAVAAPRVPAKRLDDHRLAYLDFQGPIAGGRGSVNRVDHGTYQVLEEHAEHLDIRLDGLILNCSVTLVQQGELWDIG